VGILLFAALVVGQTVNVQFIKGPELKEEAKEKVLSMHTIKAPRGNIYADNEHKTSLALSVPRYQIRIDLVTVSDEVFDNNIEELADSLESLFDTKQASQWVTDLTTQRENGNRYYLIKSNVRNDQLNRLIEFPILSLGPYAGGYIEVKENKRVLPYDLLAKRIVGYVRHRTADETNSGEADTIGVGLEYAYDKYLAGQDGEMLMKKIRGNEWKPIESDYSVEPIPGSDIYTSIDVNLQDVAESALLKQLKNQKAAWGTAIVMEVETGYIKAIANLEMDTADGNFYESFNHGIGSATEPGSTFKLASAIVGLEDGKFRVSDSVDMPGRYQFYDVVLHDSRSWGYGKNTIEYAFAKSSNVWAKIINDSYKRNPQQYIDGLKKLGLHRKLGVEIAGEAKPFIKDADNETFSGISLPWMAIGYEVQQTPMQTLALYNAVANDGKMMKPQFVKEIRKGDEVLEEYKPVVLDQRIASTNTIKTMQRLLEKVVEYGTAKGLKARGFDIAGKTGTAKIAVDNTGYGSEYQASFCGYFPADKPKYSCVVVIQGPTKDIYGASVSGTVFKEIADKVYAGGYESANQEQIDLTQYNYPFSKHGNKLKLAQVLKDMNVPVTDNGRDSEWVVTKTGKQRVEFQNRLISHDQVPNVVGMGLTDALYLLENQGLTVRVRGSGIVKDQSIDPGQEYYKGQLITIELI